jgi:hypothetical protein
VPQECSSPPEGSTAYLLSRGWAESDIGVLDGRSLGPWVLSNTARGVFSVATKPRPTDFQPAIEIPSPRKPVPIFSSQAVGATSFARSTLTLLKEQQWRETLKSQLQR